VFEATDGSLFCQGYCLYQEMKLGRETDDRLNRHYQSIVRQARMVLLTEESFKLMLSKTN
jgi:ABC-type siderophore export system fused ATPase/permease subunit